MEDNVTWLKDIPIAHRGLHGAGIPENSIPAFEHAIEKGYAIELDVQITQDKTIVVFHDKDLYRMCHLRSDVRNIKSDQLKETKLAGSGHAIPTLRQVLATTRGRVPLLIEVKHWVKANSELHTIVNALLPYKGLYAIQSFNPMILGWFRKYAPHITRGQLSGSFKEEPMNGLKKYLLSRYKLNFISKPQFLSYEASAISQKWIQRKRQSNTIPVLGWTVANPQTYDEVRGLCDNIIFEGFLP